MEPQLGIRLYQIDDGDGTRFAVTCDDQVLFQTGNYAKAVRHYAGWRGLPTLAVTGPTHQAEAELELIEQLLFGL